MAVVVMRSGKDRRRTCKRLQPGNGQADGMAIAAGTQEGEASGLRASRGWPRWMAIEASITFPRAMNEPGNKPADSGCALVDVNAYDCLMQRVKSSARTWNASSIN